MPGLLEILIIAAVVLLLFGYKRIPMLGKSLGRGISEFGRSFKKAANLADFSCDVEERGKEKTSDDGRKRN